MRKLAFAAALALCACGPSEPAKPGTAPDAAAAHFAGTWGQDEEQCAAAQDDPEAPLILSEAGSNQHEAHCDFTRVEKVGPGVWTAAGACVVEGDRALVQYRFAVRGDQLTITEQDLVTTLVRCPPS